MKKIILLIALTLTLGGCDTLEEALKIAVKGSAAIVKARDHIIAGCAEVGRYEATAEFAASWLNHCKAWHTRVVRARVVIAGVCNNVHKLGDNVPRNYVSSVAAAVRAAKETRPAGC